MSAAKQPFLDTDFQSLSKQPMTHEQMHQFKEALLVPHTKSKKAKFFLDAAATAISLVFLATLSPSQKEHIQFIDYLLVGLIAWSISFLIWGWIDDYIFKQHQMTLKIDGAYFQRKAYESLRDKKTFWDSDNIEDIIIPEQAKQTKTYVENVLHSVGRGFVRFDREIISYTLSKST